MTEEVATGALTAMMRGDQKLARACLSTLTRTEQETLEYVFSALTMICAVERERVQPARRKGGKR